MSISNFMVGAPSHTQYRDTQICPDQPIIGHLLAEVAHNVLVCGGEIDAIRADLVARGEALHYTRAAGSCRIW